VVSQLLLDEQVYEFNAHTQLRRVAVYLETPLQYRLEESVYHRRTRQMTQLFTYLLTQKLFSSCIRRSNCHVPATE